MAEDSQNIDSIHDFFYVDRSRISAYSAQLFSEGTLTGVKQTLQTTEKSDRSFKVNVGVVSAQVQGNDGNFNGIERHFDSTWSVPLNVIDRLDELQFIHKGGLDSAPIGSFILVDGILSLLDMNLLKNMWAPVTGMVLAETPTTHANKSQKSREKDEHARIGQIIAKLPPSIQLLIDTGDNQVWSSLDPSSLIPNPDDLALKYGSSVVGRWHMLGVLDAVPDSNELLKAKYNTDVQKGMFELMQVVRTTVGRPISAYGVTPILIFRSISPV